MYRLSDSRMGKYGFLEFIDRITVLDGDTGNDDGNIIAVGHNAGILGQCDLVGKLGVQVIGGQALLVGFQLCLDASTLPSLAWATKTRPQSAWSFVTSPL